MVKPLDMAIILFNLKMTIHLSRHIGKKHTKFSICIFMTDIFKNNCLWYYFRSQLKGNLKKPYIFPIFKIVHSFELGNVSLIYIENYTNLRNIFCIYMHVWFCYSKKEYITPFWHWYLLFNPREIFLCVLHCADTIILECKMRKPAEAI